MLSRFDDYPIHQTPEPIAQPASSDRNVYDRYWFNGYARDGEFYFGVGMGVYPNRGIIDCGLSIVRDGVQHAFHGSARMPAEHGAAHCGPFRIDVVEPMKRIRVTLDPNETGMACQLEFVARTACVEEGRQTKHATNGRLIMDATRFAQFGTWKGSLTYAGITLRIDPARVLGTKDRSWGIRPVGEPEPGGAPGGNLPQFFFLWSPIHWANRCTHFGYFADADGRAWHQDGAIVPVYDSPDAIPGVTDPGTEIVPDLGARIVYEPGTRRATSAEIDLVRRGGERLTIQLEPLLCFRMKGIGYMHPEWAHGWWKGESAVAGESWRTADLDPLAIENIHIQQVVRARLGDEEGVGVLEQMSLGPHRPSGFTEFLDGAR